MKTLMPKLAAFGLLAALTACSYEDLPTPTELEPKPKPESAARREIYVVSRSAAKDSAVKMAVNMRAQGDESKIKFSLIFDPAILRQQPLK